MQNTILIYTDGACSGNPGPMGVGVVLIYKDQIKRISLYIGEGTNNIAELTAIKVALESIKIKTIPIQIYTDSQYSQGVLTKNWKAKANSQLINEIKQLMATFTSIEIHYVRGHAGDKYNELANTLANKGRLNHKG